MKKFTSLITIAIILACNNETNKFIEETDSSTIKSNIAVNITLVTPQTFNAQVVANGIIEAVHRSELRFKTSEQVEKIYIKNGQKVMEGTLIANLENQLLSNALNSAEINLNNANQKLLEEKIRFGFSGKTPLDSIPEHIQKTIYQFSGYQEAKNLLENAAILLDQTLLKAPFSGTIANLTAKEGNFVTNGEVFCILLSHGKLDVIFQIMEGELNLVEIGQSVELSTFAFPEKIYKGTLTEINPMVNKDGLVSIKARINNSDPTLFDGMNVKININKPMKDLTVIPKEAVVLRSNREVVFTVKNGRSKWNYVDIVHENQLHYALSEGIQPGDTIIISNNMNLAHDADVNSSFIAPSFVKGNEITF